MELRNSLPGARKGSLSEIPGLKQKKLGFLERRRVKKEIRSIEKKIKKLKETRSKGIDNIKATANDIIRHMTRNDTPLQKQIRESERLDIKIKNLEEELNRTGEGNKQIIKSRLLKAEEQRTISNKAIRKLIGKKAFEAIAEYKAATKRQSESTSADPEITKAVGTALKKMMDADGELDAINKRMQANLDAINERMQTNSTTTQHEPTEPKATVSSTGRQLGVWYGH